MNPDVIPVLNLTAVLFPVALVALIYFKWQLRAGSVVYAVSRMVIQLVLVGFVLNYIFDNKHWASTTAVLGFIILAASWISLRTVPGRRKRLYPIALFAIFSGGTLTLSIVIGVVLRPETWYEPRWVLPLAGMIYANAMTSVSLAAERVDLEIRSGRDEKSARATALSTSLIPITNSLLAVGLVALPGMMTGQILAGVDPLIAARYQIMVMCMIFGASGLSSALFLKLRRRSSI